MSDVQLYAIYINIEMEKHIVLMSPPGQTIEPEKISLEFKNLAPLKKIERHFIVLELGNFSC